MKTQRRASAAAVLCGATLALALALAAAVGVSALQWDLSPAAGGDPAVRFQYASTIVPPNDVIMFGGSAANLRSGSELNDLWRYYSLTNLWQPITVAGESPAPRYGATLSYDSNSNKLYLFGGSSTTDAFNEMWVFDLNDGQNRWTKLEFSAGTALPTARYSHAAVVRLGSVYVFGGMTPYGPARDMWAFSLTTLSWSFVPTGNDPTTGFLGGEGVSAAYRATADTIVAFGGSPRATGFGVNTRRVVEFSFVTSNWTRLVDSGYTAAQQPIARQFAAVYIEPSTEELVLFGGYSDATQSSLYGVYALNFTNLKWRLANNEVPPPTGVYLGQAPTQRDSMRFTYVPVCTRALVLALLHALNCSL